MNFVRSLAVHLGLLALAAVFALIVWTRDEAPAAEKTEEFEVWSGRADDVKSVSFTSDKRKVSIEAHKDSVGRWYVATVDREVQRQRMQATPGGADAGPPPQPKVETTRETQTFVGVKDADKLIEQLAPLMAIRRIGKVEPARADEFGFKEPEGTLSVGFGDKLRRLVVGGTTPGGGDRYARDPESGDVYALSGEVLRGLQFAESRLIQRELHDFEDGAVERAVIIKGGSRRELLPFEGKKDAWADVASPAKLDETAGNWMTKVGRLRASDYVKTPEKPVTPQNTVVRVEYLSGKRPIGYVELAKITAADGTQYLVKSELTRWWAKVLKSSGEQIEQDLGSVVK
jgi:hypothetical protein